MPFNIASYIDGLRRSLDKLPPQARVAFAVWCAYELFREVRDYLAGKTDPTQRLAVQEAFDYVWKCASGHKPVDAEINRLEQVCAAIDWGEEKVAGDEELINVFAIEAIGSLCCALETCRTGSALSAAKAAENVLNKLDWQLSNELFVDSYSEAIWSEPKWKAELERHEKMLVFLRNQPGLTEAQSGMFRK
jgi:hypothetical protein